jgi:putative ATP-dependent endonuclease of OLD family
MTLASVLTLIEHIKWQKILTTQSGEVLSAEPLASLRRLTRHDGVLQEWRVRPNSLSTEDLRRISYHLRARRGVATFARCWLLVEGETEFWVLPELARIAGYDFSLEGIICVEFAQCGLRPLIKLACELGIEWHVLTDGDKAGKYYTDQALRFVHDEQKNQRITSLRERDIEHCFFEHGYADVFRRLARERSTQTPARHVIGRAIKHHSKPMLALELVLAASARAEPHLPAQIKNMLETCVTLARSAPHQARAHLA